MWPKSSYFVENPRVITNVENLFFPQKMSILCSILTVLASKKVSIATEQRLKYVKRYQKRVQEVKLTPELTGFIIVTRIFR